MTTVHAFELALGILAGPYIAPTIGFGVKATIGSSLEQPCQWCTSIFLEGGAELGWHAPWGEDFFEPKAIVLSEAEFSKECGPLDLGDLCDGGDAYGVTPTPESTFDCQTMNFKFRAPGAAGAGQDDAEIAFIIDLEIWSAPNDEWILWETFSSADTPWNGWPSLWFHCEDVGPGWGECTYVQNQSGEASLCGQHMMPTDKARWSVTRFGDPAPLFTYEFFVTGSVG